MPLTLTPELREALDRASARETWDSLPLETQSALLSFVKDGWLGRTRRRRSATIATLCHEGADAVFAWQEGNARAAQAFRVGRPMAP